MRSGRERKRRKNMKETRLKCAAKARLRRVFLPGAPVLPADVRLHLYIDDLSEPLRRRAAGKATGCPGGERAISSRGFGTVFLLL